MAQIQMNLEGVEATEAIELLPDGPYKAIVFDSEIKEGPKGPYINWTFKIDGKPNHIWDIMSVNNEVAQRRLKTLATVCGHKNPNYIGDTEELHGKEFLAIVTTEPGKGEWGPKNKVKSFRPLEKPAVVPPKKTPAADSAPEPDSDQKMPWDS